MVGYTAPNDLTSVQGTGANSGISLSDLELKSSVAYGGKIGYFFPGANWLGIETELYNTTPHVKQQSVTASGFGVTVPIGTLPGFNLRVLNWGINAIVRYPGKTFQPYAGVGLGVFLPKRSSRGNRIATPPRAQRARRNPDCSRPTTWRCSLNINTIGRRSIFPPRSASRLIIRPIFSWAGSRTTFNRR